MTPDMFDFGFTAVNADELDIAQSASQTADELTLAREKLTKLDDELTVASEKLRKLEAAIHPLLDNLAKNPEKDYIFWPKRQEKISQFRSFIGEITQN